MRRIAVIISLVLIIPLSVSAAGGGIDPSYPYAWSENLGWINFYTTGDVEVTDTGLTGYAWSDNTGWINMHPSSTVYVHNDGQGNLSGYAWGEGIGYIDFSGVTIDAQGYFHGYASSTISGRINFNCENMNACGASDFKVKTYWQPPATNPPITNSPPVSAPGGGGGGGGSGGSGGGSGIPFALISSTTAGTSTIALVPALSAAVAPPFSSAASSTQKTFSSPGARCPYFIKSLQEGMTDPQVKLMQSFLMYYGYMASDTPTTYFGAKSYAGVKAFQAAHASEILTPWGDTLPTGRWYITTRKAANELVDCVETGTLLVNDNGGPGPVNVRANPTRSSPLLTKVSPGTIYDYYDQSEGWYYVDYAIGKSGWVWGGYVTVTARSILEE